MTIRQKYYLLIILGFVTMFSGLRLALFVGGDTGWPLVLLYGLLGCLCVMPASEIENDYFRRTGRWIR